MEREIVDRSTGAAERKPFIRLERMSRRRQVFWILALAIIESLIVWFYPVPM